MKGSRTLVGLAIGLMAACNAILGNEEGVLKGGDDTGGSAGDAQAGESGSTRGGSAGRGGTSGSGGTSTGGQAGAEGGAPDGTGGVSGDAGDAGEPATGGDGMGGTAGSGMSGAGMGGASMGGAGMGGASGGGMGGGGAGGSGGGCNQACNSINGTANCSTGTCMLTCATNFANVDGMGSNGCEVDLRTNEDNCGRVGNDCFVGACSNGTCIGRKLVFATSSGIRGDFGGFTAADGLCQQLADQAALAGTYRAWLSTAAGSPSTRFVRATVPYVRTDGARVAANYTALTGIAGIENPINLDQNGNAVTYTNTWTSTKDNGTYHTGTGSAFGDCTSWTVTSGNGVYGRVTALVGWSQFGGALNCTFSYGLYCFQQ